MLNRVLVIACGESTIHQISNWISSISWFFVIKFYFFWCIESKPLPPDHEPNTIAHDNTCTGWRKYGGQPHQVTTITASDLVFCQWTAANGVKSRLAQTWRVEKVNGAIINSPPKTLINQATSQAYGSRDVRERAWVYLILVIRVLPFY